MPDSNDEPISGDLPVTPAYAQSQFGGEEGPSVSHVVIASYVADAARSVKGIVELRTSAWKNLARRVRETHSAGVVVKDADPGAVDVEIHAQIAWGARIPELARQVEEAVRERVTALLNINLRVVTLFVDEIASPAEGGATEES